MVSPARTVEGPDRLAEADAAETAGGGAKARQNRKLKSIARIFFIKIPLSSASLRLDAALPQKEGFDLDEVGDGNRLIAAGVGRLGRGPVELYLAQQVGFDGEHIGDGDFSVSVGISGDHNGQRLQNGAAVP